MTTSGIRYFKRSLFSNLKHWAIVGFGVFTVFSFYIRQLEMAYGVAFVFFILVMFGGFNMYYFGLSSTDLIVQNQYFFWVKKIFKISDIEHASFFRKSNSNSMPGIMSLELVINCDNQKITKRFGASSLSSDDWRAFQNELENSGIRFRKFY